MRTKSRTVLILVLFLVAVRSALFPCTIAVVSGRATTDGRPLLWKNRDADVLDNKLLYITGGTYAFLGIVNFDDHSAQRVWAGMNTAGLAVINAAAPDLGRSASSGSDNGRFLKYALSECATVREFENLLKRSAGRRDTASHYGVIDAEGNACLFETGADSFAKFDAADPRVAPQGYILRTNFSFTAAQKGAGGGYIRFERAERLFQAARAENRLTYRFILQEASRDLVNEKLHSTPLSGEVRGDAVNPLYINTNDTINRNSTACAAVFHGVGDKALAYLTTMWVLLGQPVTSVAVPVWLTVPGVPVVLTGESRAPLSEAARELQLYLYPDRRGHMPQYLNVTRLRTFGGSGVLRRTLEIEKLIMDKAEHAMREWARARPTLREVMAFEGQTANWALASFRSAFAGLKFADRPGSQPLSGR